MTESRKGVTSAVIALAWGFAVAGCGAGDAGDHPTAGGSSVAGDRMVIVDRMANQARLARPGGATARDPWRHERRGCTRGVHAAHSRGLDG